MFRSFLIFSEKPYGINTPQGLSRSCSTSSTPPTSPRRARKATGEIGQPTTSTLPRVVAATATYGGSGGGAAAAAIVVAPLTAGDSFPVLGPVVAKPLLKNNVATESQSSLTERGETQ